MRYLLCMALCFGISFTAAAKKRSKKKPKANIALVEAYSQRIVPGIPGSQPQTSIHIIAVWEGSSYPESMFWRGDGVWLGCNIAEARKIVNRQYIRANYLEYQTTKISPDKIQKGDTLQIDPLPGGKLPLPADIPDAAQNTLLFKASGSKWLSLHIDTIVKKHDIVKP